MAFLLETQGFLDLQVSVFTQKLLPQICLQRLWQKDFFPETRVDAGDSELRILWIMRTFSQHYPYPVYGVFRRESCNSGFP
jgi:hypothetical protein